jgi:hypothetical protein
MVVMPFQKEVVRMAESDMRNAILGIDPGDKLTIVRATPTIWVVLMPEPQDSFTVEIKSEGA